MKTQKTFGSAAALVIMLISLSATEAQAFSLANQWNSAKTSIKGFCTNHKIALKRILIGTACVAALGIVAYACHLSAERVKASEIIYKKFIDHIAQHPSSYGCDVGGPELETWTEEAKKLILMLGTSKKDLLIMDYIKHLNEQLVDIKHS